MAAKGREGWRRKRGRDRKERARWRNCHASRMKIPFLTQWKGVYLPGNSHTRRKGGIGEGERMSGRPYVVSGPLPWMLMGVWFHISLGNDCLMEKLGALKMRKEKWKCKTAVGWFLLRARLSWSEVLQLISLRILKWIITMWLCEKGGGSTHTPMCT